MKTGEQTHATQTKRRTRVHKEGSPTSCSLWLTIWRNLIRDLLVIWCKKSFCNKLSHASKQNLLIQKLFSFVHLFKKCHQNFMICSHLAWCSVQLAKFDTDKYSPLKLFAKIVFIYLMMNTTIYLFLFKMSVMCSATDLINLHLMPTPTFMFLVTLHSTNI